MAIASCLAILAVAAASAAAAPDGLPGPGLGEAAAGGLRGASHGASTNSSALLRGGPPGQPNGKFKLAEEYDLGADPKAAFDVVAIPDQNLTHSCSNYTDDGQTVFTRDGKLVLKVSSACPDGKCLNSGRVMSKKEYKYGVFAFTAKVPKCNGIWPAIWMLPGNTNGTGAYGDWPCSGEIDILETTGSGSVGTFNLVAGYGSQGGCGGGHVCNRCGGWGPFCVSSTIEKLFESFYEVEQPDCSADHPTWQEHVFVLDWQPTRVAVYVDPKLVKDGQGNLVEIVPKPRPPTSGFPTWKEYVYESTPTWKAVNDFMDTCHDEKATMGAPFDQPMKIVLNIAVGGYGGAPCTWGQDECTAAGACGGTIGSEMELSDISVFEWVQA